MFFSTPEPDTRTVLVVPSETRSVSSVLFMVLIIGAIGFFIFLYFGGQKTVNPLLSSTIPATEGTTTQTAQTTYQQQPPAQQQQAVNASIPQLLQEGTELPPTQTQDVLGMLASAFLGTPPPSSGGTNDALPQLPMPLEVLEADRWETRHLQLSRKLKK